MKYKPLDCLCMLAWPLYSGLLLLNEVFSLFFNACHAMQCRDQGRSRLST